MDQAVRNASTLKGTNFRTTFEEIWDRGRYDIPQFASDFLDIGLHDGQIKWMDSHPWADERYLASGNRFGKTVSDEVKVLHHALYQTRLPKYSELTHRYIAINLSITLDMANIAWDGAYVKAMDSPLYRQFLIEDQCKRTPFPIMVIGSGGKGRGSWRSEIWARSTAKRGKYLLGKDFDFVCYDEAARDPDGPYVRDDVLLMRLADRSGRIDYTSTGNFRNWYYQDWIRARDLYSKLGEAANVYAQTGSSYENPYIDHEKLKRNEERLGEEYRNQNIYGGFANAAVVFQPDDLERCYLGQDYPMPVAPVAKGEYVGGVDWGRREDETVILVCRIDVRPAKLVYARSMGGFSVKWEDIYKEVARVHREYNRCYFLVDSTAQAGDMHVQALKNQYSMERFEGYNFAGTKSRKEDLIVAGQRAVQNRRIVWPYIPTLYDQLAFYDYNDKHLDTDWVMAFCLMGMALQRETWVDDYDDSVIVVGAGINRVPGEPIPDSGPIDRLLQGDYDYMNF